MPGQRGRKDIPSRGNGMDKRIRCRHSCSSKDMCRGANGGETGQTDRVQTVKGLGCCAQGPQLHLEQRVGSEATGQESAPGPFRTGGSKADLLSQLHLLQRLPS